MINSEKDSDKALHTRIAEGDGQAFAQIHAQYKTRLFYYARRFHLDWHQIEDLVAESFLALWRSKDQVHSEIHIRNFLFITVRNKAINLLAAQKRQATLLEKWNATQDPTDQTLAAETVETEMLDLLQQAIKTLPTECKRIFMLSYHAEHSPAEIARLLHMNPATVRSQKRRAIQLIQQWIRNNTPPSSTLIAALGTTLHFLNKFFTILCTLAILICN